MKLTCKKYTVGDVAKLYGVSPDTVRLYDKKQLLVSQKNGEKGYRIYTRKDISSFEHILKLKNSGIMLNDIYEFTNNYSLSDAYSYCCKRMEDLDHEIEELQDKKIRLQALTREIRQLNEHLEEITVEYSPSIYLKEIRDSVEDAQKWGRERGLSAHTKMVMYNDKNFIQSDLLDWDRASMRAESAEFYLSIPIEEKDVETLKHQLHGKNRLWHHKFCVHARLKAKYSSELIFKDVRRIQEFIDQHHFVLENGLLMELVFKEKIQTEELFYYDLWCPIKM